MKLLTVKIKAYEYAELSQKAKDRAYEKWCEDTPADSWDGEYRGILEKLEDIFDCTITHWQVGIGEYDFSLRTDIDDFYSPVRLAKYIIKKSGIEEKDLDNCPFSGFCGDSGATDVIKKAFTFSLNYSSYYRFLSKMFDSFFSAWARDRESQVSRETFEETDDRLYFENGRVCLYEDGKEY